MRSKRDLMALLRRLFHADLPSDGFDSTVRSTHQRIDRLDARLEALRIRVDVQAHKRAP